MVQRPTQLCPTTMSKTRRPGSEVSDVCADRSWAWAI